MRSGGGTRLKWSIFRQRKKENEAVLKIGIVCASRAVDQRNEQWAVYGERMVNFTSRFEGKKKAKRERNKADHQ